MSCHCRPHPTPTPQTFKGTFLRLGNKLTYNKAAASELITECIYLLNIRTSLVGFCQTQTVYSGIQTTRTLGLNILYDQLSEDDDISREAEDMDAYDEEHVQPVPGHAAIAVAPA